MGVEILSWGVGLLVVAEYPTLGAVPEGGPPPCFACAEKTAVYAHSKLVPVVYLSRVPAGSGDGNTRAGSCVGAAGGAWACAWTARTTGTCVVVGVGGAGAKACSCMGTAAAAAVIAAKACSCMGTNQEVE